MHRKLLTSDIWERRTYDVSKLWDWCLLNANWEDNPERNLRAGELSFSLRFIQQAMVWTDEKGRRKTPALGTIRSHLEWLVGRKMIEKRLAQGQTLISICNWETYQSDKFLTDTVTDTVIDTVIDTNQRKNKKYKKREGYTREANVTIHTEPLKPIDLPDDQLLPADPTFEAQQIVQRYTQLCSEQRKMPEPIAGKVINALHRDPTAERQLSSDEVETIITEQVKSGYPLKLSQLWNANPSQGNLPYWESNLLMAQRRRNNTNHGVKNGNSTRNIDAELAAGHEFDRKLNERGWTLIDYYTSGEQF